MQFYSLIRELGRAGIDILQMVFDASLSDRNNASQCCKTHNLCAHYLFITLCIFSNFCHPFKFLSSFYICHFKFCYLFTLFAMYAPYVHTYMYLPYKPYTQLSFLIYWKFTPCANTLFHTTGVACHCAILIWKDRVIGELNHTYITFKNKRHFLKHGLHSFARFLWAIICQNIHVCQILWGLA